MAAKESADAYAVGSISLNFALVDLCQNRLLADLLQSISLRILRYVWLGLVTAPRTIDRSLEGWRAMHKASVKRDRDLLLSLARQGIDDARDAAILALSDNPAAGRQPARVSERASSVEPAQAPTLAKSRRKSSLTQAQGSKCIGIERHRLRSHTRPVAPACH